MDDDPRHKAAGTIKVFIAVVIGVVLLAVAVVIARQPDKKQDTSSGTGTPKVENTTTSPDQVKESGGSNGDTAPSPSGTGPGSDNSLLSQ
ncbi:MAG TPA: hypothetical protein VD706_01305 [Candidatus Saccharimonadales bacterium]|nr:hypothetical protein [Candidatus Saccharimonadales bacterium]